MSVRVHLHRSHRAAADNLKSVDVDGHTVSDCLAALIRRFPGLESKLFTSSGSLRRSVEIYVNRQSAFPNELAQRVKDGDDIHLTLILTGG